MTSNNNNNILTKPVHIINTTFLVGKFNFLLDTFYSKNEVIKYLSNEIIGYFFFFFICFWGLFHLEIYFFV